MTRADEVAPEVSVLLPVKNAAATLAVAVRSVLRSREVALELIVVDHASNDGSAQLLVRAAARDARVRILGAPDGVALPEVLEQARAAARAPHVARMDADDVMHPLRLRDDVRRLREQPSLAVVACRTKLIPRGRVPPGLRAYAAWQNTVLTPEEHARELWIEQPLCHPACTFRASALQQVGGWRTVDGPEDYDLFLRMALDDMRMEKRPQMHHAWRIHAQTTSRFSRDVFARMKASALVQRFALGARRVIVAGAGKEGGRMARALAEHGVAVHAFVDVAPRRLGRLRHNARVHPVSALPTLALAGDAFVVGAVGTSGARGVVRATLAAAGFVEGVSSVVVA